MAAEITVAGIAKPRSQHLRMSVGRVEGDLVALVPMHMSKLHYGHSALETAEAEADDMKAVDGCAGPGKDLNIDMYQHCGSGK